MIAYTYSGGSNGITCADGSPATLTRSTPDGIWTYARSESGTASTTTITDPQNNQTVVQFQGFYETAALNISRIDFWYAASDNRYLL